VPLCYRGREKGKEIEYFLMTDCVTDGRKKGKPFIFNQSTESGEARMKEKKENRISRERF